MTGLQNSNRSKWTSPFFSLLELRVRAVQQTTQNQLGLSFIMAPSPCITISPSSLTKLLVPTLYLTITQPENLYKQKGNKNHLQFPIHTFQKFSTS